jgi:hypothetical protein
MVHGQAVEADNRSLLVVVVHASRDRKDSAERVAAAGMAPKAARTNVGRARELVIVRWAVEDTPEALVTESVVLQMTDGCPQANRNGPWQVLAVQNSVVWQQAPFLVVAHKGHLAGVISASAAEVAVQAES